MAIFKNILAAVLVSCLTCTVCLGTRTDVIINSGWLFHHGALADSGTDEWQRINLPHTWNAEDAFDDTPGYYRGECWYRRDFTADKDWEGKTVVIKFEGANQVADLYVNGQHLGTHSGGYTAFSYDISSQLKFGERNVILVRVDNSHSEDIPPLNADFTFYGGIYRNVHLIVAGPVHFDLGDLASDGVFADSFNITEEHADISVRGSVCVPDGIREKLTVTAEVVDQKGTVVADGSLAIKSKKSGTVPFLLSGIGLQKPNLWSPESPYLYTVRVSVKSVKGEAYDQIDLPLGVRWYSFDGDGFYLNGEKYSLNGVCRHQDISGKGDAMTDGEQRKDFEKIKSLGFNFVRLAHYPQAQEVYRACDELGLLVWSEIPVVNMITPSEAFRNNSLTMQREHIRQTCNHPSVIVYGYMNEVLIKALSNSKLQKDSLDRICGSTCNLARELQAVTKEEAPERYTAMAIHYHKGYNDCGITDIPDIVGYNLYFGWYYETLEDLTRHLEEEHRKYPDRPIIVSEYGAGTDVRNHTQVPRPWDFSEEYYLLYTQSYLKQFKEMDFLAGHTAWAFADFGSASRGDALPFVNQKGLLTFDRKEKSAARLYAANYNPAPLLEFADNDYRNRVLTGNGCGQTVYLIGNGGSVTLFNDGVEVGKKAFSYGLASFDVTLKDGVNHLSAVDERGMTAGLDINARVIPENLFNGWDGKTIAINVGAYQSYVKSDSDMIYIPDRLYVPGGWGRVGGVPREKFDRQRKVGISNNIFNCDDNPLFQTFCEGIEAYRFDVADGDYKVTLHFIEPNKPGRTESLVYNLSSETPVEVKAGKRVFSILANSEEVVPHLDLAGDYGHLTAVTITFDVHAREGKGVVISFVPEAGKTILSGIEIERKNRTVVPQQF